MLGFFVSRFGLRSWWALGGGGLLVAICCVVPSAREADVKPDHDCELISFRRIHLTPTFHGEGANVGDLNRDGKMDVVSGPYWYAGPDFRDWATGPDIKKRYAFRPPTHFDILADQLQYADNNFIFIHDFSGDGWPDILTLGFPPHIAARMGSHRFPAGPPTWYENPRGRYADDKGGPVHWKAHKVLDGVEVDGESPAFSDLFGTGKPALLFLAGGRLTWAGPDWSEPTRPWASHPISGSRETYMRYDVHGMGVGDVNGDGRADVLMQDGWWEQPADAREGKVWTFHPVEFRAPSVGTHYQGGAQMWVFDVDGDGRSDVVTVLNSHAYGLAWFQNVKGPDDQITFHKHLIMGSKPEENHYGLVFSQMHALACSDVDGDGIPDLVVGKRPYAHGFERDADPNGAKVLYWFRTVRGKDGVDFVPYRIDDKSGVGTQLVVTDIDGDGRPDIVVGNKLGSFVFLQQRQQVLLEEWEKAQPDPRR